MQPPLDGRAWLGRAQAFGTTFVVEPWRSRRAFGLISCQIFPARSECLQEPLQVVLVAAPARTVRGRGVVGAQCTGRAIINAPGELP
jgi:hypothetical protein